MNRWLRYCVKKARSRETTQKYRLHAILVRGGSVLAQGFNVGANDCYGRSFNPKAPEWIGLHAEMACLRRATEGQTVGSILYVGGVTPADALILTQPCNWCENVLTESGLYAVVWHDTTGTVHRWRLNTRREHDRAS